MTSAPCSEQSFASCPKCSSLCLGPTILPCGHVLCRKCLRKLFMSQESVPSCPSCGYCIPRGQGRTVTELLDQFNTDIVLQDIVADHIVRQTDLHCQMCPKQVSNKVCLDCQTFYCTTCSEIHRCQYAAETHAVKNLRPISVPTSPAPCRRPSNQARLPQTLNQCQRLQCRLLAEKDTKMGQADSDLEDVRQKLQQGRDMIQAQQHFLRNYMTRMPTMVNTPAMGSRLKRLREDTQLPPTDVMEDLVKAADELIAVWDVSRNRTTDSPGDEMSPEVPPEYQINVDLKEARDVTICQQHVEVHVWKKFGRSHSTGEDSAYIDENDATTEKVVITPHATVINMDLGSVRVDRITDDAIQRAVEDVVIAKMDWFKELGRDQELKREKQHLVCKLQREKAKGRQQLESEKCRMEAELASLYRTHQAEKRKERQKLKRFVLQMEKEKGKLLKEVLKKIREKNVMSKLVQRLFDDFQVRLLGVDSGLRFLMDAPAEEWNELQKKARELQKVMEEMLLRKREQKGVTWTEVTQCGPEAGETDLRLGRPIPADLKSATPVGIRECGEEEAISAENSVSFDPTTAIPQRIGKFRPDVPGCTDYLGPIITSMVATEDGRLVLADYRTRMVIVADGTNPDTVRGVRLQDPPRRLSLLQDGTLAVTSDRKSLYLVDVHEEPSVAAWVQTSRQYSGVCAGITDDTLIVSCGKDDGRPASVDVISRTGKFKRTVVDNSSLEDLCYPSYLHLTGKDVLVSDWKANAVFRVDLTTSRVVARLTHPDMDWPRQIAADPSGNVFIACKGSRCVLVMSACGRWRRLLEGYEHGDKPRVKPWGVCVAGQRLAVSWTDPDYNGYSVVAQYDLA